MPGNLFQESNLGLLPSETPQWHKLSAVQGVGSVREDEEISSR